MPHESSIRQTRVLLSGLGMGESPRWHDGRLWFSSWGTNEIIAVDLDGNAEVMGPGGGGSGWAANWLPDGRLLVTGEELIRVEPDGSRVRHADLSHISPYGWSEITVDGRGNVFVDSLNFDFADFNDVLASGEGHGEDRARDARG
jgi:sugar lactone lactonase YvrE